MRPTRSFLLAAAATLGAACHADDAVTNSKLILDEASAQVAVFARLADSITASNGDPELVTAFHGIASAIWQNGRVAPIGITIDGVPTNFLATVQQTEITNSPCGAAPGCLALGTVTTVRTVIAWQRDNPKRIIQITSASDKDTVQTLIYPSFAPLHYPTALFVFMDGTGGTYFGTSGTQQAVITKSDTPCTPTFPDVGLHVINYVAPTCTNASFDVGFSVKAEPSSFLAARNNARGTHALTMAAQAVRGARLQLAPGVLPHPPVPVTPSVGLPALLTATVDGDVSLALNVTNTASTPAAVTFSSGQHCEFTIIDAVTGATVWTWSANKSFTQALSTESIGAHTTVTYAATWKPTQKGSFIAVGSLVSQSHHADAKVLFTVK
ncbi:MAG: hypothetical protein JWM95_5329 [Gemmatimonadetes bacterium]|nr:hypothetical protein [Gemmatimonadota bacterium]